MAIRRGRDRSVVPAENFDNAVNTAAARMNVSQHEMAVALTYFFEAMIEEVANGNPVEVVGVGAWFPVMAFTRRNPNGAMPVRRPVIYFCPVRPWRYEVASRCPPAVAERNLGLYSRYRNHRTFRTRDSGVQEVHPSLGLSKWRKAISKDIVQKTFRTEYHAPASRRVR